MRRVQPTGVPTIAPTVPTIVPTAVPTIAPTVTPTPTVTPITVPLEQQAPNNRLVMAALLGDINTIQESLDRGADVNAVISDADTPSCTALIGAARNGHTKAVLFLLRAGADINAKDPWGNTSLMSAIHCGHIEAALLLLGERADVNATNLRGETALTRAADDGHTKVVLSLLRAGADVNAASLYGRTALIGAAGAGHTGALLSLLGAGANVNAASSRGDTAFTLIMQDKKRSISANAAIAVLLINKGAIIGSQISPFLQELGVIRERTPVIFNVLADLLPKNHPVSIELDFAPTAEQQAEITRVRGCINAVANSFVGSGYDQEEASLKAVVKVTEIFGSLNPFLRNLEKIKDCLSTNLVNDPDWLRLRAVRSLPQRAIFHFFEYVPFAKKKYDHVMALVNLVNSLFGEVREGESEISASIRAIEDHRTKMIARSVDPDSSISEATVQPLREVTFQRIV